MTEKNRELWQVTAIIAINLAILVLLMTVFRADAVCLGQSGEKVAAIQKALANQGFYSGEADGNFNLATRKAVKEFQKANGLDSNGEADFETLVRLGISAQSGSSFALETEILARYLKLCGGKDYPEMLRNAENILSDSEESTLTRAVFDKGGFSSDSLISAEPSSESYSAALHALKRRGLL